MSTRTTPVFVLLASCLLIAPSVWAGGPTYDEACRLRDEARRLTSDWTQSPLTAICEAADALDAAGSRHEAIALLLQPAEWMRYGAWANDEAGVVLLVDRLLVYADMLSDTRLRVTALQVRGHSLAANGDVQRGLAAVRQAVAEATRMGAPVLRAEVVQSFLELWHQVRAGAADLDVGSDTRDALSDLQSQPAGGRTAARAAAILALAPLAAAHGEKPAAATALRSLLSECITARDHDTVASVLSALAAQLGKAGTPELDEAIAEARKCLAHLGAPLDGLQIVEVLLRQCGVPAQELAPDSQRMLEALTDASYNDTICRVHLVAASVADARGDERALSSHVYEAAHAAPIGLQHRDWSWTLEKVTTWAETCGSPEAAIDALLRCQGELPVNFLEQRWQLAEELAKLRAAARGDEFPSPADLQPLRELLAYVPLDNAQNVRRWIDLAKAYTNAGDAATAASLLADVSGAAERVGDWSDSRLTTDAALALIRARTATGSDEAAAHVAACLVADVRAKGLMVDEAVLSGGALENAGRAQEAQALYREAVETFGAKRYGSSTELLTEALVWSLLEQGRAEEAAALLPPVDLGPDGSVLNRHRLWPLQAVCALARDDLRTARTLTKDQPRGTDLLERLLLPLPDGENTLSAGTLRRARFRAQTAVGLLGATDAKPEVLGRAYLELGRIAVGLHEYAAALGGLDHAQRLLGSAGPDTTRPLFALLAKAHEELGHAGAAAEYRDLAEPPKQAQRQRGG